MKKKVYDLLEFYPVDRRTLMAAVKRAGATITRIGKTPFIPAEDFDAIRRNGINYYKDRMTAGGDLR